MKFNDVLKLAFKNVGFKALRSWLTILGIVVGIASIVGLMTFGDSINNGIESQLSTLGSDNVVIQPGAPVQGIRSVPGSFQQEESNGYLDENDINELRNIDNVEAVSPIVSERYEIEYGDETASLIVNFIIPSEYEKINSGIIFEDGFMISDTDDERAVIGYSVAHNIFEEEIETGDIIIINEDYEFKVEGILKNEGMGGSDNNILISIEYINNIINDWDESYDSITVKLKDSDLLEATTEEINEVLRDSHDVEEGEEDFSIQDYSGMLDTVSEMISLLTALLTGIASISLLVGGISISNSMFTSVFERTREIGIMKAIGADDGEIKALFLAESMIISLIGGIGGVIIGLGFAQIIISLAPVLFSGLGNISLMINPLLLVEVMLFSVIIGALSGYFPADKASKLDPIEAIWYE